MNIITKLTDTMPLFLLLTAGTAFTAYRLTSCKKKLKIGVATALLLAVMHTLIGLLTVKVFAFMEMGTYGGMSLFGGVFFMPVLYIIGAKLSKRSIADVCDVFTPCIIFTIMCARVNCIVTGCCLGQFIPGLNGVRWPTRELELVFYISLLIYLYKKERKGHIQGSLYPLYMFTYGIFRFFVEGFRESANAANIMHLSHLWAAISAIIGFSIYSELVNKSNTRGRKA